MFRSWATLGLAAALAVPGCSSAAPPPPSQECFDSDDCAPGEECLLDQGGICLNLGIPARRQVLGMDITEGDFRIELLGCDAEIEPIDGELRTDPRERLSSPIELTARSERPTVGCADCSTGATCEPGGALCTSPYEGSFAIRRASRLGLSTTRRDGLAYPILDEMMMPTDMPVVIDWARYAPTNVDADLPTILELTPANSALARMRFEVAAPPDETPRSFEPVSRLDCHRQVAGRVRRLGVGGGIEGATVAMDFDEAIASTTTVLGAGANELPPCSGDEDCAPGRACNPVARRCALDLTGTQAARDVSSDAMGDFAAPVYTYCEDAEVDTRDLRITVTPPEGSALPRVHVPVEQAFALPLLGTPVSPDPLEGDLCLPDWPAPTAFELPFRGSPVQLLSNEEGEYVCCSTECLPTAQEARPPSQAQNCDQTQISVLAAATFEVEDPQPWIDDGCLLPDLDEAGRFEVSASCEAGVCPLSLSAGSSDAGLSYTLEVISPPGSVFRSELRAVNVAADTTELPEIELRPRVVVEGRIQCDAALGEDCVPEDVSVVAERIRMPGESPDTPPPYLYDTTTVADGSYLLLVDPGVYVMTALPPRGAQGGPGPFVVVDLRLGTSTSLVNVKDGVPTAAAPVMQIEAGVPVVLRLRDFGRNGRVRPLDRGSWVAQGGVSDPDGRPLDLNDPATCYAAVSGSRGCEIRSLLRPRSGSLVTSISSAADFTMRFLGGIECPDP